MPRPLAPWLVLVALAAGCVPPAVSLEGKQCDPQGRCAEGYVCAGGQCVKPECEPGAVRACPAQGPGCAPPSQTCGADHRWGACQGGGAPSPEVCDGLDNDCNNAVDDLDGGALLCPLQQGVCAGATALCGGSRGWLSCDADRYLANHPAYSPTELCDGLDNDCNGAADDALPAHPCAEQRGACAGAVARCGGDAGWLSCEASDFAAHNPAYAPAESCDGVDNDCNGLVDDLDGGPLCPEQRGVCAGSMQSCSDGGYRACTAASYGPDYATTERCDGLDNDCNGQVDDHLPPQPCPLQQGACAGSQARCGGDAGWLSCDPGDYLAHNPAYAPAELCDGVDNDCNGQVDDHLPAHLCAEQRGACAGSVARCGGDAGWLACTGSDFAAADGGYSPSEVCDGLDNDCNGLADDGFLCALGQDGGACATSCGTTGQLRCDSSCGAFACAPPAEVCNGLDDDCDPDGGIDNGLSGATAGQVSADPDTATRSSVAASEAGGLVAYLDNRGSDGGFRLWLQVVDADLRPSGSPRELDASGAEQSSPAAVRLGAGYAVAWIEGALPGQVYLAELDAAGATTSGPTAVSSLAHSAWALALASDGTHAQVVWEDDRSGTPEIFGAAVGGGLSPAEQRLVSDAVPLHNPAVALAPDGASFGVAYEAEGSPAQQVKLAGFDYPAGTPQGTPSVASGANYASHPSVAAAGSTGFAVAWQDLVGSATNLTDIALRLPGGAPGDPPLYVSPHDGSSNSPSLVAGPDGSFGVAWEDDRSGTLRIRLARLDAAGAVQAEREPTPRQSLAPFATFTGSTYAVSWEGDASGNFEIYTRRLCP